jgi:hypothetical protein
MLMEVYLVLLCIDVDNLNEVAEDPEIRDEGHQNGTKN